MTLTTPLLLRRSAGKDVDVKGLALKVQPVASLDFWDTDAVEKALRDPCKTAKKFFGSMA